MSNKEIGLEISEQEMEYGKLTQGEQVPVELVQVALLVEVLIFILSLVLLAVVEQVNLILQPLSPLK